MTSALFGMVGSGKTFEGGAVRRRLLLVALIVVLGMFAALAASASDWPGGTFTDDNGNTHEGNIEAIASDGVTRGCNPPQNTAYCPHDDVSRGAMAAFIKRALNLPDSNADFFVDDNGSTFEDDINAIAAAGVTRGCNPPANDRYCPGDPVTRGAMAAFLVRAFGYTDNGGGDLFIDDNGSTFENDIDKLGTAGVTQGCNPPTNDRYCPNNLVLRDQMASFLARALDLPSQKPTPVSTFGPGAHVVGTDMPAGLYRNVGFSGFCYWERLSGFSGEFDDIVANEFDEVNQIVQIKGTDVGFFADPECGTWTNQLTSSRMFDPSAPFGPGNYLVGHEITPGTWRNSPGGNCYWERKSGFGNNFADIIANDFGDTQSIVQIQASDAGFHASSNCGTWTKIG